MNYKSARWKKLRINILKRDGYMCRECRRFGKRVDARVVHHVYPAELYPEYRWCRWNLVSLCDKCHENMHERTSHNLTNKGEDLKKRTVPPTSANSEDGTGDRTEGSISNSD